MAEPTLSSLLTRIEILERHVRALELAATITRRPPQKPRPAAPGTQETRP
jgi:hypothetical protein